MTNSHNWLEFLKTQGASIKNGRITGFDTRKNPLPDLLSHTVLAPLDNMAIIRVSGEDNLDFLQNQFSNDVRLVSDYRSQLAAYCSAKGRVLSLFRVIKQGDSYFLLLPRERLQATINRLKMFILRSKVIMEDASETLGVLGIAGRDAQTVIKNLMTAVPQAVDDCVSTQALTAVKIPGNPEHYLLLGDYTALEQCWLQCKQHVEAVPPDSWTYYTIQGGVPEVLEVNSDEFVPQMLNLHSLNAINFKKGCYPGQEVVARMHYLGKQKRRMYLAHITSDTAPIPGDSIYSEADATGQSVGRIVTVGDSPGGGYDVLVVMQIASVENGDPVLTGGNAPLIFKELPYAVEVEGKK